MYVKKRKLFFCDIFFYIFVSKNKYVSQNYYTMKIAYYLNEERKKNLYCRISDGTKRVTFSLDYTIDPKNWNEKKEEVNDENEYYFTLIDFKKYLTKKYYEFQNEGKDEVLERLKNEALSFSKNEGLEGIAKNMFDYFNKESSLPKYEEFVQAFEKFSKLKKGNYKTKTIDNIIHFHTKDGVYEMDTYEGLTARLKDFIEKRSYDEIYTETNENIWGEIYIDAGIEKIVFIPDLLKEWEMYWYEKYQDIRERIGKTDHLDAQKQESWRHFQVFMECYNDSPDIVKLAYSIDDMKLYPLVVITMLQIFNAEVCYGEYCEHEFSGNAEWEAIDINEEDDDSPIFYVREYEL